MCCTLESALSDEELFLEQAFPRKYFPPRSPPLLSKGSSEHEKAYVNEHY